MYVGSRLGAQYGRRTAYSARQWSQNAIFQARRAITSTAAPHLHPSLCPDAAHEDVALRLGSRRAKLLRAQEVPGIGSVSLWAARVEGGS